MAAATSSLVVRLVDQASQPARRVSRAVLGIQSAAASTGATFRTRLDTAMARNEAALGRAQGAMVGAIGGFYALRGAIGAPVRAAMEFGSAMADVKKVVDFPTPESFKEFQQSIIAMSRELPMSVAQLSEMAAIGGSSGLAGDNLLQFVEQAAKLGVAMDISAEQAGDFQNAMRSALGLDLTQVLGVADALNHLSNNMASTAPKLRDFVTRVAGDLKGVGFTAEEALAFGSAMIASGHQADVAATSFRNMTRKLAMGDSGSRRTKDALAMLGLEATETARAMQEDAVGTIIDVFERIGQMPEHVQAALRSDIFGNEARAVAGLVSNTDLLREALGLVADETDYAGSAYAEYEARARVFGTTVQTFTNRITGLGIVIGTALIPALTDMTEILGPLVTQVAEFVDAHPALVSNAMLAAGALVSLKIAAAALKFVGLLGRGGALSLLSIGLNTVGAASMRLRAAAAANIAYQASLSGMAGAGPLGRMGKARAALRGMALAVPGLAKLGGIFTALKIGIVAVGGAIAGISAPVWGAIAAAVLAAGAAAFYLWKKWDAVRAFVGGFVGALRDELQPVLTAIAPATDLVGAAFGAMGNAISGVVDWIMAAWGKLKDWIGGAFVKDTFSDEQIGDFEQGGANLARGMVKGIKAVIGAYIKALTFLPRQIIAAIGKIDLSGIVKFPSLPSWLGGGDDDAPAAGAGAGGAPRPVGPSPAGAGRGAAVGARAGGGPVLAGRAYLVGEEGPELVTPRADGQVHDAAATRAALGGAWGGRGGRAGRGGPASVTLQISSPLIGTVHVATGRDPLAVVEQIGEALEERLARAMRGLHGDGAGGLA